MRFRLMPCDSEVHGDGSGGTLYRGDVRQMGDMLRARYQGLVQTVYLDPPFNTGKSFVLRQRIGEAGWASGKASLSLPAYTDRFTDDAAYLAMMREAVELSHALLSDEGSLFLHIDARMHAHLRLMLDEVFGAEGFVNEIIWAYQTGGRSLAHFSRKHDIILFYRKTKNAYFNMKAVGVPRAKTRKNHMRRSVDERGRAYRSIVSQGKEYRYYDDDPVYPGDVWDDVSHLQQKDPQRTGYDTQKPMRLLERIILCASRPGDLVCDLFSGSGTTAVAAAAQDRRFLAMDQSALSIATTRKRLLGEPMRVETPCDEGLPHLDGYYTLGLGLGEVRLTEYTMESWVSGLKLPGVEAVEQVSVGYLRDRVFYAFDSAARTKLTPALPEVLELPVLDGIPALLTVDYLGRRLAHALEV